MTAPAVLAVARMCLALPETGEKKSHGARAFVHRDRIYCWLMEDHHGSGRMEAHVKADMAVQRECLQRDSTRFFRPPYVGPRGWVGVVLGPAESPQSLTGSLVDDLAELLVDGYLSLVTRRVAAVIDPAGLLDRVRAAGAGSRT